MNQASSSSSTKNSLSSKNKLSRGPSELYPVVQDLSDAEYGCGCGETFGSFQLSDLVLPVAVPSPSMWNTLCATSPGVVKPPLKHNPIEENDNLERPRTSDGDSRTSDLRDYHRNALRTPIKRYSLSQRDSSDSFPVPSSATRDEPQPSHPLFGNTPSEPFQAPDDQRQRTNDLSYVEDDGDNANAGMVAQAQLYPNSNNNDQQQKQQPTSGRKLLRRKSRQLMNMLMVKSPTSSNRDLSTTDTMTDSYHMQSAVEDDESRRFEDCYVLVRQMFKCRYSELWECVSKSTGVAFCVKILERGDKSELDMLQMVTGSNGGHPHPNIVSLVEAFEHGSRLYAIMEMEGMNLLTKVVKEGAMEEARVKQLARSLLDGLCYLHSKSIVHNDLAPDNILFPVGGDSSCVKIADLGCAVDLECEYKHQKPVSVSLYSAPEVIRGSISCDASTDMWSLGCLVYFMLSGTCSPFDEGNESSATRRSRILRAEYSFPRRSFGNISRAAKQFIAALIHVDESVRLTAAEALDHPWFNEEEKVPHQRQSCWDASSPVCQKRGTSPFRGTSPKSVSSKHHRRLSSIGKGLTKLFFAKENESIMESASGDGPGRMYPSSPARSVGASGKKSRSKSHRRQLTE